MLARFLSLTLSLPPALHSPSTPHLTHPIPISPPSQHNSPSLSLISILQGSAEAFDLVLLFQMAPYARLGKRGAAEHIGVRLWQLIIVAGTYGNAERACV